MRYILIALITLATIACNRVKEKAKDAVNTAGDAAGQAAGEFAKGVGDGVEKAFDVSPEYTKAFTDKGLKAGDVKLGSDSNATDNVLNIYIIFEKDFKGNVLAKANNSKGLEMGRSTITIVGKKGEAKYVEFKFDKLTNIDADSKVVVE